jgi:hypothetical protein
MADIVSELASRCGISEDVAHKGLGIVLEFLKSKLPAESFAKLSAAVPGADDMMAAAADTCEQPGGVVGVVKDALGHLFGGGSTEALLAKFGQLGLSPEQVQAFIPKLVESLKDRLPENVQGQVHGLLPTTEDATH